MTETMGPCAICELEEWMAALSILWGSRVEDKDSKSGKKMIQGTGIGRHCCFGQGFGRHGPAHGQGRKTT